MCMRHPNLIVTANSQFAVRGPPVYDALREFSREEALLPAALLGIELQDPFPEIKYKDVPLHQA